MLIQPGRVGTARISLHKAPDDFQPRRFDWLVTQSAEGLDRVPAALVLRLFLAKTLPNISFPRAGAWEQGHIYSTPSPLNGK